jgi:hypothetical protein
MGHIYNLTLFEACVVCLVVGVKVAAASSPWVDEFVKTLRSVFSRRTMTVRS